MAVVLLIFGAIIAVAAFNNAQGTLATELEQDVPPFIKWLLAVGAIGGIGFIPGMEKISRWLLALVFLVIFLKNYSAIYAGFQALGGAATATTTTASATPASAYTANPTNPQVTTNEVTGTGSVPGSTLVQGGAIAGNINAAGQQIASTLPAPSPYGAFDPNNFLAEFEAGFGGFGGVA
jgi:hypothetical protein